MRWGSKKVIDIKVPLQFYLIIIKLGVIYNVYSELLFPSDSFSILPMIKEILQNLVIK